MEENSLVTVVITTYNRPRLVRRAIDSVLRQTYKNLEIIVVDDDPGSNLASWIEQRNLQNLTYLRHDTNLGLAAARNTGLRHARGKYIAYLDDDDEWIDEKIAQQVALVQECDDTVQVVYCGALIVSPDGKVMGKNKPRLRGNIRDYIAEKGLYTIPSSCLFLRTALEQLGGHDQELTSHIDHDLWLSMAKANFRADYVDRFLVRQYHHQHYRMTADVDARLKATQVLCKKWYPDLATWYGAKRAGRYCRQFKARVIAMLGWANLEADHRRKALRFFLRALYAHPTNFKHYRGLFAAIVGYSWYARLVGVWKRLAGQSAV
jgi:glycosyltransferase involved in cell wall biosynthesis